jgi:hypothetical protein
MVFFDIATLNDVSDRPSFGYLREFHDDGIDAMLYPFDLDSPPNELYSQLSSVLSMPKMGPEKSG